MIREEVTLIYVVVSPQSFASSPYLPRWVERGRWQEETSKIHYRGEEKENLRKKKK